MSTDTSELKTPPVAEVDWDAPGMSNFDGSIDEGAEDWLISGKVSTHAGWNFNGDLWFEDGMFYEAVNCFHVHVATFSAPTLAELMELVNDEYGWE